MDVVLLGGALGVSLSLAPTCVMQHFPGDHHPTTRRRRWSPLAISLGLSFGMFALSVLEAMPSSWLIILDNRIVAGAATLTDDGSSREPEEYLSLSFAYLVVLTLMAAYVLVVCPSMAGVMVLDRVFQMSSCNNLLCCCKEKPWWLELLARMISCIYKAIFLLFSIVFFMLQKFWRLCFKGRATKRDSDNGLPITQNESTSCNRRCSVRSVHCLMGSFYELLLLRGGTFLMGSVFGIAGTLAALHWLAPFIIEPKSMENWLSVAVCWMTSIGILLSQFVNGFGSVSMPHSCLAGLYLDPIRAETVDKATIDLEKTRESLQARKQKFKEMRWGTQVSATAPKISPTNVTSAWTLGSTKRFKRTFSAMGEEVTQQKKKLLQEIMFLETLVEEMTEDVEDMKYTQQIEAESRTTMGRIKSWLGVIFSVVLLGRLYFAAMAIWRHWYSSDIDAGEQTKKDPVTTALLFLVGHHMVTKKEYDELSQFISLLLTAILSFSQIRAFLRTVAAMHRRINQLFCPARTSARLSSLTPRSDTSSGGGAVADESATTFRTRTGVYMHILAALMGSYFLACIVMTKAMLPWQYRASFSGALGGFDAFVIQSDVITAMFATSAVASAIVLALLFGIQKSNAVRHNVSWMDDLASPTSRDLDV